MKQRTLLPLVSNLLRFQIQIPTKFIKQSGSWRNFTENHQFKNLCAWRQHKQLVYHNFRFNKLRKMRQRLLKTWIKMTEKEKKWIISITSWLNSMALLVESGTSPNLKTSVHRGTLFERLTRIKECPPKRGLCADKIRKKKHNAYIHKPGVCSQSKNLIAESIEFHQTQSNYWNSFDWINWMVTESINI